MYIGSQVGSLARHAGISVLYSLGTDYKIDTHTIECSSAEPGGMQSGSTVSCYRKTAAVTCSDGQEWFRPCYESARPYCAREDFT